MSSSPDDDALRWAGDNDPTLASGDAPARDGQGDADAPGDFATSSVALVGVGILAGIYLLYTIGWFLGVTRLGNPLADPLGRTLFGLGGWLAVAAPLVWFGTTYVLTGDRPRLRLIWLLIGVVLLAPLPFISGAGGIS